jgi:hypothetical protein
MTLYYIFAGKSIENCKMGEKGIAIGREVWYNIIPKRYRR